MWFLPLAGLLMGLFIGTKLSLEIPSALNHYYAAVLVVLLDTILGAVKNIFDNIFDNTFLLIEFISKLFIAMFLVFLGEQLNVDLYLLVYFTFGFSMLNKMGAVRTFVYRKYKKEA
ncbi:MAG: small basic family protein [Clostridia bacterium]|nr:small basic family protein [Clostridia bacterium]